MNNIDNQKIGKNIKEYRNKKGLTQSELAEAIGKTESSIRKYEKGLVQVPNDVLKKIADSLDIQTYLLVDWDYLETIVKEVEFNDRFKQTFGERSVDLLRYYSKLNDIGQNKAIEYVTDLVDQPKYQKKEK